MWVPRQDSALVVKWGRRSGERLSAWGPVVLWAAVILIASGDAFNASHTETLLAVVLHLAFPAVTPATIAAINRVVRKGAHVFEYGVLGVLMMRAVGGREAAARHVGFVILIAVSVAGAVAILDETHQAFIASRTGVATDALIDTAGAVLGCGARQLWRSFRRPRPPAGSD